MWERTYEQSLSSYKECQMESILGFSEMRNERTYIF
jgi:hypothetical protein